MKKLGAYIGNSRSDVEKNTFVWYEIIRSSSQIIAADTYEILIWSLKGGYPNGRKFDARYRTRDPHCIEDIVIPMKDIVNKYCIEWENNGFWQIKEWMGFYDYHHDYECITVLKVDQFGSNNSCHWEWKGESIFSILKNATVNRVCKLNDSVMPVTIKEELKKSLLNSCYGMGGFTTRPVLSPEEIGILFDSKNKETKTMEKKKMTVTDLFLKDLNGIAITSTYAKLDHGCSQPYYIYYPEIEEITEDIADTLLTVLLMAKKDFIHKIVFNPEKGTTTIYRSLGDPVTVRCKDSEFDYILGYEMARTKMYLGSDDYNWFNKIKNHRKTHVEYTEKKTKKGGKK